MGVRKYKLTTLGRHGASIFDLIEPTRSIPEKSLLVPKPKTSGRNSPGHITTRHIGGGHKQAYHIIDFRCYGKSEVPMKVAHIEYGPNHTARITLPHYRDSEKRYIIAFNGLTQGTVVVFGPGSNIRPSNNLELRQIPIGTTMHTVELRPGGGAKLGRSASTAIQLVVHEDKYATLRIPPGEMCVTDVHCRAAIDTVDNAGQSGISRGKAGRNRWKGIRPTVRGVVMDPVNHPHGGGEGRASGGRHPVFPRGKPEGRTRDKSKADSRFIVCRRKTDKKR